MSKAKGHRLVFSVPGFLDAAVLNQTPPELLNRPGGCSTGSSLTGLTPIYSDIYNPVPIVRRRGVSSVRDNHVVPRLRGIKGNEK